VVSNSFYSKFRIDNDSCNRNYLDNNFRINQYIDANYVNQTGLDLSKRSLDIDNQINDLSNT
jgi:hypothetical protein